jgi:uncharacterized protein involved in response to NO
MFKSNSYFLSQVHQPFFLLSFLNAIILIVIFALSMHGIIATKINTSLFHAFGLIYLFFTPAFFGFLFTTFPRFLQLNINTKDSYIKIYIGFIFTSLIFILGSMYSIFLAQLSMLLVFLLILWAFKILLYMHKESTSLKKHDTFWILVGLFFGIVSSFLFIFSLQNIYLIQIASSIAIYLYLFVLAFSVAQRMIPFFSNCQYTKNESFLKIVTLLLFMHVVVYNITNNGTFVIDLFLSLIILKEILRWKLPFPNPNPMLWILHLSIFWIPLSFFISSITTLISYLYDYHFVYISEHLLVLGFIFTVLIGFGTRVTLGHSGNSMYANKLTRVLFIMTQLLVFSRVLLSIFASMSIDFQIIFDITICVWIVVFVLWIYQYSKVLIFGNKL